MNVKELSVKKLSPEKCTRGLQRAGMLLLALGGAVTAAQAAESRFYVDARVGTANTSVTSSDLERDFAHKGIDADVYDIDRRRTGYALAVGMEVIDHLSAELGYLDLSEVKLNFNTGATAIDLAKFHPESGSGVTLGMRYSYPLSSSFSAQARAGLFAWSGDYTTHRGDGKVDHDTESHTDFYWGAGVGYALSDRVDLGVDFQRIEFQRYPTTLLTAGVRWRFGL